MATGTAELVEACLRGSFWMLALRSDLSSAWCWLGGWIALLALVSFSRSLSALRLWFWPSRFLISPACDSAPLHATPKLRPLSSTASASPRHPILLFLDLYFLLFAEIRQPDVCPLDCILVFDGEVLTRKYTYMFNHSLPARGIDTVETRDAPSVVSSILCFGSSSGSPLHRITHIHLSCRRLLVVSRVFVSDFFCFLFSLNSPKTTTTTLRYSSSHHPIYTSHAVVILDVTTT